MSQWSQYSVPDPELEKVLKTRKGSFDLPHDIFTRRKLFDKLARKAINAAGEGSCKSYCPPTPTATVLKEQAVNGISVNERKINVFRPAGEIDIRIYTPDAKHAKEAYPVLMNFHGTQ